MKEAVILRDTSIHIRDAPVPKPKPGEVLIEVHAAGLNPKDYKTFLVPMDDAFPLNMGDDIAGIVAEVGEGVTNVKKGDRVIAYHPITTKGGAWATYATAPAYTTAVISPDVPFAAAATVPLAAMTAALANYEICKLPEPDSPATAPTPFLVYGASSTVGAFAIKLAILSNVHPIIAVAGGGAAAVKPLLDPGKGDVLLDYRGKEGAAIEFEITDALRGADLHYAFDAVTIGHSAQTTINVVANGGYAATVMPPPDGFGVPIGVSWSIPNALSVHSGLNMLPRSESAVAFGSKYFPLLAKWLGEGKLPPHPYQVIPGGLDGVAKGLENLKSGKNSGVKYIVELGA